MSGSAPMCFDFIRGRALAMAGAAALRVAPLLLAPLLLAPGLAAAGQPAAEAAITRAGARIEMATRQSGVAGNDGDQSYNMARSRLEAARAALKAGHEDEAQSLAEEASLLAELTTEKAKLAALQTSRDQVAASVAASTTVQP